MKDKDKTGAMKLTAPEGYENNWLETVPEKSWFTIFRVYSPLEPWIEKTGR